MPPATYGVPVVQVMPEPALARADVGRPVASLRFPPLPPAPNERHPQPAKQPPGSTPEPETSLWSTAGKAPAEPVGAPVEGPAWPELPALTRLEAESDPWHRAARFERELRGE
jgi:hypothetical protein